ncbi:hypothetical protein PCK1_002429 [Pneumocystis canis]|nr:hypothetical protein PCK1_002429 [Pneumocystis canis]
MEKENMDLNKGEMMNYELASSELLLKCEISKKFEKILSFEGSPNEKYLDTIALLLLDPKFTLIVAELYYPILSSLVIRWNTLEGEKNGEIMCALAKLLFLVPTLKPYISKILDRCSSFLSTLNTVYNSENQYKTEVYDTTSFFSELLLAAYRLIVFDPVFFSPFISISYVWPCLYHQARIVRFLALEILCILLCISGSKREELISLYIGSGSIDYMYFGKIIDFSFFFLFENELKMNFLNRVASRNYFSMNVTRIIHDSDHSNLVVPICGINLPRLGLLSSDDTNFVITPVSQKNLQSFVKMLLIQKPILLLGPYGSGKTFMVESVAKMLGNYDNLVRIYMGDQVDIKSLIGTYVIGLKPGVFEWKPGILTKAVQNGRYVLIENIDKASSEIMGVLLPLLEKNELEISSRGEKVAAASGFQIIATMSINMYKKDNVKFLGRRLWETVNVDEIPLEELSIIIYSKFPLLQKLTQKIIEVYKAVISMYSNSMFHNVSKIAFGRVVSIRDLMKWCKRIVVFFNNNGIVLESSYISRYILDNMFYNAVDCFSAMIQTNAGKSLIIQKIGQTIGCMPDWVDLYIKSYIPKYEDLDNCIKIGRVALQKSSEFIISRFKHSFAFTSSALKLLEQLGVSIESGEHVLLVGETGTGKTATVQYLANILGRELIIVNMSQQTESTDLVGGFKPIDLKRVSVSLKDQFDSLFGIIFSTQKNLNFLEAIQRAYSSGKWKYMVRLFKVAIIAAKKRISLFYDNEKTETPDHFYKKRRRFGPELKQKFELFSDAVLNFENYILKKSKFFIFDFLEGPLTKAIRNGTWILLDEINLAEYGILENIGGILQENGSILLSERGDINPILPHPNFRLFACMNPATDVGKRDLSLSLRSRFTEFFVYSPDENFNDLLLIIHKYIGHLVFSDEKVLYDVAQLHLEAKKLENENRLIDSAGQKPYYSIRTLTRTLMYVNEVCQLYELRRSLYEGFCMLYLTLLESKSEEILHPIIKQYTLNRAKNLKSLVGQIPKKPSDGDYIQFKHYWMLKGNYEIQKDDDYIITQTVEKNMLNLVRAITTGKFPILVQGPTSSGKTSMIEYIAKLSGHKFVRINNHKHTDLQEYLGAYVSDNYGNLKFKEGIMVEALRNGYWIVLDELNLAPSDVLEALNRLLDDNRELFIFETQEVLKPHPHFMLFATQNPPGIYGGRKYLSRAFRNRFLELHYDDIPENELRTILCNRCRIPPSYGMKMVEIYKKLSLQRQSSRIFQQKSSFVTLRDLFRWATREFSCYQEFVNNGYMLLAERVRKNDEKIIVKEIIETVMKAKIDEDGLYNFTDLGELPSDYFPNLDGIVWTKAMKRLFRLISIALENDEPVLLVGETGTGKTSICQAISKKHSSFLHIVNVHQNTESGDIIGAQRPIRNKDMICKRLHDNISKLLRYIDPANFNDSQSATFSSLVTAFLGLKINDTKENLKGTGYDDIIDSIEKDFGQYKKMFEWCDGALVKAMKSGEYFLLDEISLADDSVLERFNSVLEPSRTITLSEKSIDENLIKAKDGFKFMATMNPGGDYGKKELSPALRNRFTEIWVPSTFDEEDVLKIVCSKLRNEFHQYSKVLVLFSFWFQRKFSLDLSGTLSLRDILVWVDYMNLPNIHTSFTHYILHGAVLVYIDKIGVNTGMFSRLTAEQILNKRLESVDYLSGLIGENLREEFLKVPQITFEKKTLRIGPFSFCRGPNIMDCSSYSLHAPTVSFNAMRILRAMQTSKPILLEGSPGVGKTSLVSTIASVAGFQLVRINLSEQTDLMDLFGSDLPADGETAEFVWHDGPFLHAMKNGHWVLLDEMNLASQSILEGLNACFDHRAQAFIPELNQTFTCHPSFRVFAAQNPHFQGGGRKGLPKSFINRFTVVYIEKMSFQDLLFICDYIFPNENENSEIKKKVILFIERLNDELSRNSNFGLYGRPWEFNLRDILRWFEILQYAKSDLCGKSPDFLDIIIKQRFRTIKDREIVDEIYQEVFENAPYVQSLYYRLSTSFFQVGHALLLRNSTLSYNKNFFFSIFKSQLKNLESLIFCIQFNWPCILVGSSASGKTSLVRFISSISGTKLVEFSINNDIDTMDIVGGFQQIDLVLKLNRFIIDIEKFCKDRLRLLVVLSQKENMKYVNIYVHILELIKVKGRHTVPDYRKLLSDLVLLFTELSNLSMTHDFLFHQIFQKLKKYVLVDDTYKPTQFEWFDSILVQAVKNGDWLLLDNANLCNPSVLDRLNSLMEPKGTLILNERNSLDGKPLLINSHPNFRIILTMDPVNGELSRAMRNRCVEIFFDRLQFDNQTESTMFSYPFYNDSIFFNSLSSFIFNHFGLYTSVLKKYYSEKNMPILGDLFLEQMPIKQIDLLKRWYSTYIIKSDMFSHIKEDIILNLIYKCTEFQKSFLYQEIFDFYKSILGSLDSFKEFVNIQPTYPSGNPYIRNILFDPLFHLNPTYTCSMHIKLCYMYDLFSKYLDLKITLEVIQKKTLNALNTNMTILEKSSLDLHRDEMNVLLHTNIFRFLSSLLNEIKLLLILENFDYINQEFVEGILDLVDIWHHIYEFTNVHFIDYSKYHVYNNSLQIWNQKYVKFFPENSRKRFNELIKMFDLNFELKTGFSMEIIWEKIRPSIPKFEYAWSIYKELILHMDRFDNSFQYNVCASNTLLNIRTLFLENCYSIFTVSSDIAETSLKIDSFHANFKIQDFVKDLQNNMNKIDIHNDISINIRPSSVVIESFNTIFSCLEVYLIDYILKFGFISKDMYDMIVSVDLWTYRPSSSLIPYIIAYKGAEATNESLVSQVLDSYFTIKNEYFTSSQYFESLIESPPSFPFFGKTIKTIAMAIYNMRNALFEDFQQLKSDLSNLVVQIFRHTWYIKNDKKSFFIEIFIEKFIHIFGIHKFLYCFSDYEVILTSLRDLLEFKSSSNQKITRNLEDLKERLQRTEHEKLKTAIKLYFTPSLLIFFSYLQKLDVTESEFVLILGKAFLYFELGFLYLYVPNLPYDPAIFPIVQTELHKKNLDRISNEIDLRKLYENEFTGCNDNFSIKNLEERYKNLVLKKTVLPEVYRPSVSEVTGIYREFEKLLQMFIVNRSLENIIERFENKDVDVILHLNMVQRTIHELINRFDSYLYYTDILKPICESLKVMNFALILIKQGERFSKFPSEDLTMIIFLNLFDINTILTKPLNITFITLFLKEAPSYKFTDIFLDRFMIFCLIKLSFFKRCLFLGDSSDYVEIADYIFRYFYLKWVVGRDEKIKLALEKESVYKTSQLEDQVDYQALFPEFEGIAKEFNESKSLKIDHLDQCYIELVEIHKKLFDESESSISCFELLNSALDLGIQLLTMENLNINSKVDDIALPSLIYYMKDIVKDSNFILPISHNFNNWVYNFYKDPNINESIKLSLILKNLKSKAQQFLKEFPENFILHEIITRLDIILKLGIEAPLSQSLIALEQLYSVVDQWKVTADAEYSLDASMEDMKNLIIAWRKFELNCWDDLFRLEDKEKQNEITVWWFYLYENLIYKELNPLFSADDIENYINELISLLDQFITTSPLGQFEKRLRLIDSFSYHLVAINNTEFIRKKVLLAFKNFVALYSLYIPKIRDAICQGKDVLEKKIKDIIQLARWKDTNFYVLKESARKSHWSLYKIIKKYRELLSTPSLPILINSSTESLLLTSQCNITASYNLELKLAVVNQELLKWSLDYFKLVDFTYRIDAPCRHKNVLNTVLNMWSIVTQKYVQDLTFSENPFELFTINIVENMKELQNLTLTSMSDDMKSEINYLKTRKKRLFSDILSELRRIGLKTNPSIVVIKKVSSINNLLATIPYYNINTLKDGGSFSSIRIINEDFYRLITFITKIRQCQNDCSSDISMNEISRSLGLMNSLFYMVLLERSSLMRILFEVQRFEKNFSILSLLQTMIFEKNTSFIKNYRKNKYIYDNFQSFLKHIRNIVSVLEDIRVSHSNTTSLPLLGKLEEDFNLISEESKEFEIEFELLGGLDRIVMDKAADTFVSNFMGWMEKILERMLSYSIESTSCAYLVTPVVNLIKDTMDSLKSLQLQIFENDNEKFSMEFDIFMRNMSDEILLVIQKLINIKSFDVKQNSNDVLEDACSLEMENINCLLEKSIAEVNKLNITGFSNIQVLFNIKAICCLTIPILDQYLIIVKYILENFINHHMSVTKFALLFAIVLNTLIEKGFFDMYSDLDGTSESIHDNQANFGSGDETLDDEFGEVDDQNSSIVDQKFWNQENAELRDLNRNSNHKLDDDNNDLESLQDKENEFSEVRENFNVNDDKKDGEISDNEETMENVQENEFYDNIEHIEPLNLPDNANLDNKDDHISDNNTYLDLDCGELDHDELNSIDEYENNDINGSEINSDSELDNDKQVINDKYEKDIDDNNENGSAGVGIQNDSKTDENCQDLGDLDEPSAFQDNFPVLDLNETFHMKEQNSDEKNVAPGVSDNRLTDKGSGQLPGNINNEFLGNDNDLKMKQEYDSIESLNDSYRSLGDALEKWNKIINKVFDPVEHYDVSDNNDFSKDANEYMMDNHLKENIEVSVPLFEKQEKDIHFDTEKDNLHDISKYYNDLDIEKLNDSSGDTKMINTENLDTDVSSAEIGCLKTDIRHDMNGVFLENMLDLDKKVLHDNNFSDLLDSESESLGLISIDDAMRLWRSHEESVHDLSIHLCEQLRLILEPTLATKMQGDYRTGKRLNMRRIIPYIASQYRKDKIWMRRTKPSKRQYQVMICMDDSKSMIESGSMSLAFETLALISKALSLLEVGEICIVSFGEKPLLIHPFKEPFTSESGARLIRQFKFNQSTTDVKALMEMSIKMLEIEKNMLHIKSNTELWQLEIIVSDGICEDHDSLRRLLRRARELKIMVVFVIVDVIHEKKMTSLFDMKQVRYKTMLDGSVSLEIINYMDEFAFDHYVIVRNVKELTHVLANALRQWLIEVSQL